MCRIGTGYVKPNSARTVGLKRKGYNNIIQENKGGIQEKFLEKNKKINPKF